MNNVSAAQVAKYKVHLQLDDKYYTDLFQGLAGHSSVFLSIQLEGEYTRFQVQRQGHFQMAKQSFLFVASSNQTFLDGVLLEQTPE